MTVAKGGELREGVKEGRMPSKCKQMLSQYSACVKNFDNAQEKNAVKIGNGGRG